MNDDQTWNDETREDLRERLRENILGEVRLAKRSQIEILQSCREFPIQEDAPESEWKVFIQYATEELDRTVAIHAAEQEKWPEVTDCDRLDRVEESLRDRGILLWQVSPCCDTCTGGEIPDRIDTIDRRNPGFRDRLRGYSFFIDQNMPDSLTEDTKLTICLAYGWFSPSDETVDEAEYNENALGIGKEVCECLREHGFQPDWVGDFAKKICFSLNWQRRTLLE